MRLSIREVSRFIIGAAIMRNEAMKASGNAQITFDQLALVTFREDVNGEKMRFAIEELADRESGWMRNTPPHTLKTERVMKSREAELRTFAAINAAVVATVELADDAKDNAQAYRALFSKYMEVFATLDRTPGSAQDKQRLKSQLRDQTLAVAIDNKFTATLFKKAEAAYLEAGIAAILSRYSALDCSDDFNT